MKYIIPFLIAFVFILLNNFNEKFTVPFKDYGLPNYGYCCSSLTEKEFQTGKYSTHCWKDMSIEECDLINAKGLNCGYNLETGEPLKCFHKPGDCKNEVQCYGSCFDQVGPFNGPYMIPVTRDNVIGLG